MTRPSVALVALAALLAGACALRGLSQEGLSGQPIALLYWEPEEARKRVELLESTSPATTMREGIARIDRLGRLLG